MKIDEIRELVHAVPFQAFTLYMAGGTAFDVVHPDFIALSPTGRTVIVYPLEGKSHKLLDVMLISQIDVHDSSVDVPDSSQPS